jgi:hypothetical protein
MSVPTEILINELRASVRQIEKIIRDLEIGKAKVVPSFISGHTWAHFLREEPAPSVALQSGELVPMVKKEQCVDILKPWGFYIYIADCPKTGVRFVESTGKFF